MKVAIAASLVGAIVGELPTGAVAGIGAKLLAGSYYSQTIDIWAALVAGSVLAAILVAIVGIAARIVDRSMGRPAGMKGMSFFPGRACSPFSSASLRNCHAAAAYRHDSDAVAPYRWCNVIFILALLIAAAAAISFINLSHGFIGHNPVHRRTWSRASAAASREDHRQRRQCAAYILLPATTPPAWLLSPGAASPCCPDDPAAGAVRATMAYGC